MKEVNRHMITLARESRGLNQRDFAALIDMSNSNIGKMENGDIGVSEENLKTIANETDYPIHFFLQPGEIISENLSWRKRRKVPQKFMIPINARANIITRQIQILNKALNINKTIVPSFDLKKELTPQKIATLFRKEWKIDNIKDTSLLKKIEDEGIIVNAFDFKTTRIDSLAMLTEDKRPVIFINNTIEGDRQRFTLAYELGQLAMFTYTENHSTADITSDCNAFAAEFLMPENEIRPDFNTGVTFQSIAALKAKWKVSMIALLYRADDLGYVTPNQKRYIIQQFNEAGIRRHEPEALKIPKEEPRLMKFLIGELRNKGKLSVMDTAALLCLQIGEFMEMYS